MPEVIFNGTEGRLEGRYHHAKSATAPIALVLHPYPLHGGTMNNKVVFTLHQEFQKRGFSVLRFNYRGVGRSQGTFDDAQGALSDGASALDWVESISPNASECWVAGYSYGAWIGMQLMMRRPEIRRFIAVVPPAGVEDFSFLAPCPASGLIVSGDKDLVVTPAAANKLANKMASQKNIKIDHRQIAGADHLFTNRHAQLAACISEYMDRVRAAAV